MINETPWGTWLVIPINDGPALDRCPCCNRPITTEMSAWAIADAHYPMRGETRN